MKNEISLEKKIGKKDLTIYDLKDIVVNFNSDDLMEVLSSLKNDNEELKKFYEELFHLGLKFEQNELIKKGVF